MTPAEFKCAREHMGLTTSWLAERWGVAVMSVKRYERDRRLPERLEDDMNALIADFDWAVADAIVRGDGYIEVPRTDADALGDKPASYYRALAWEVSSRTGGTIVYRGAAGGAYE